MYFCYAFDRQRIRGEATCSWVVRSAVQPLTVISRDAISLKNLSYCSLCEWALVKGVQGQRSKVKVNGGSMDFDGVSVTSRHTCFSQVTKHGRDIRFTRNDINVGLCVCT